MKRTAFVSGAGRRVGRAVALELAKTGFEVALHYRNSKAAVEEVSRQCEQAGGTAWCIQGDLASLDDVQRIGEALNNRWEHLDILVNNASLFEPVPFGEITAHQWDEMMAVNVRAPFLLSRDALPLLRAANGLVVHMCDIGGDRPMPGYAHYSVSKSAIIGLVKSMAVELGPDVRCVGISPGHVVWPEDWDEAFREKMLERIALKRVGRAKDVGTLIHFLWKDGTYIHGDVIAVDGGLGAHY